MERKSRPLPQLILTIHDSVSNSFWSPIRFFSLLVHHHNRPFELQRWVFSENYTRTTVFAYLLPQPQLRIRPIPYPYTLHTHRLADLFDSPDSPPLVADRQRTAQARGIPSRVDTSASIGVDAEPRPQLETLYDSILTSLWEKLGIAQHPVVPWIRTRPTADQYHGHSEIIGGGTK